MSYTYEYPRPAVTVDCLVFSKENEHVWLMLIQRDKAPFEKFWALPGGFVEIDEDLDEAAYRELKEETSISDIKLRQFRAFGKPGRDPRGRTISIVYHGFVDPGKTAATAGSDARNVDWFDINDLPPLAFDHDEIIEMARRKLEI
ncbi:MAG: NUDIX domain-containing protein [Bacteroidota bacterium]